MQINRFWITEKPDMARNLAAGLALTYGAKVVNEKAMRQEGCIRLDNGDAVGFLFGHMLELAPPQDYLTEEQNKGDVFKYLPLMPAEFVKLPKPERVIGTGEVKRDRGGKPLPQFQLVKLVEHIRAAREIVNAGDTDREGQLIVDELLMHAGVDPHGATKPVWRLALQNPKDDEIRKLIHAGLEKNSDPKWARRYKAAYARETFDWCLGMTASRAYRQITGFQRMSVGRVTTPTLMLTVAREEAIEKFKPAQFYVPVITLSDGTQLRWFRRAGAEGAPGFDTEGRIVSEAVARQIVSAILGGFKGEISLAEALKKFQPPPLPHSLGTLQSTVSRRTGLALKEVTRAAQSLYERHKMITYVGTDCRYLPTSMLQESHDIVQGLAKMYPKQSTGADLDLRSKAWNDSKTDEHFAIAPTGRVATGLDEAEKKVFEVVTQRFLAQFYPAHEYVALRLQAVFGQDEFKANSREVVKAGWKSVEYDPDDKEAGDGDDLGMDVEAKAERKVARDVE
ncbi:DNA topoisomerase [Ramlibacter sp. AN1133]|uniref:DNA topoisomerase n=1 Tax=Ramlibacter sp. AN1133 TaxID=3133429 RepID=UPI0030BC986B